MIPFEFRRNLWRQKTRVIGLSYGVVCVITRLAILVQCRLVTDRQTDKRTDGHTTTSYTALAERRAVINDDDGDDNNIMSIIDSRKSDSGAWRHPHECLPQVPRGLIFSTASRV